MILALLAACVPVGTGPPPTPLPQGQSGEVGFSVAGGVVTAIDPALDRQPGFGGGFWARADLSNGWAFLARFELGVPYGLSAGAGIRYGILRSDGAYVGLQAELGLLYAGGSLPAAFRLGDRVWLWTRPGFTFGQIAHASLPIGLTAELGKRMALHGEAQLLTPFFDARFLGRQPISASLGLSLSSRF